MSSPAALTDLQLSLHDGLLNELTQRGLRTVRLERSQYARVPWEQLRTAVATSDGAVVFGFRQLRVDTGESRPDTQETRSAAGWYATPWNHIEAGLAIMAGLPVLTVSDAEVTEGIFSPDVWGNGVFGVAQGPSGEWEPSPLEAWSAAVAERARQRGG